MVLKEHYLRNVFDEGTNQFNVAQRITDIDPFNDLAIRSCYDATENYYRKRTPNDDSPGP